MAITVSGGLFVSNNEPADNRTIFNTVDDAINSVGVARRYDGLQVRIKDSDGNGTPAFYIFRQTGVPALNPSNWELVPDPAVAGGGGGASAIPEPDDDGKLHARVRQPSSDEGEWAKIYDQVVFLKFANFPDEGDARTLYIDLDSRDFYNWETAIQLDDEDPPNETEVSGYRVISPATDQIILLDRANFPVEGDPRYLYIDLADRTLYIWNGTEYQTLINTELSDLSVHKIISEDAANLLKESENDQKLTLEAADLVAEGTNALSEVDGKLLVVPGAVDVPSIISVDANNSTTVGEDGKVFTPPLGDHWQFIPATDEPGDRNGRLVNQELAHSTLTEETLQTSFSGINSQLGSLSTTVGTTVATMSGLSTAVSDLSASNLNLSGRVGTLESQIPEWEHVITLEIDPETEEPVIDPETNEPVNTSKGTIRNKNLNEETLVKSAILQAINELITSHDISNASHGDMRTKVDLSIGMPEWNQNTQTLTFTAANGTSMEVNFATSSLFKSARVEDGHLILVLANDEELDPINLQDLITEYVGSIGADIQVSINGGVISASIISESITRTHLDAELQNQLFNIPSVNNVVTVNSTQNITATKTFVPTNSNDPGIRAAKIHPFIPTGGIEIGVVNSSSVNMTGNNVNINSATNANINSGITNINSVHTYIDGRECIELTTDLSNANSEIHVRTPKVDFHNTRLNNVGDALELTDALTLGVANERYLQVGQGYPLLLEAATVEQARSLSTVNPSNIYWVAS
jgi:hypothetical protein